MNLNEYKEKAVEIVMEPMISLPPTMLKLVSL